MFLCIFQPQQGSSVTHPVNFILIYTHLSLSDSPLPWLPQLSPNCWSPCAIQGVSLSLLTQLRGTVSAKRNLCWVQSVPGFNFETRGRWGRDSGVIYQQKCSFVTFVAACFHKVIRWTLNDSEVVELNRLRDSCSLLLLWEQLRVKGERRGEACLWHKCQAKSISTTRHRPTYILK